MGEFLGWLSYDLRYGCEFCQEFDLESLEDHLDCEQCDQGELQDEE